MPIRASKDLSTKILIAAAVVALVALFFALDLGKYLSLGYIKGSQARFEALYAENPMLVIGGYMLVYIVVTGLSLPGAAVMTLAGGALFGLAAGVVIISFASTIGATLACFLARFILRDFIERRFGDRLKTINEGMAREGAFYLFTLRLVPIFPFFVINLVMGLTRLRLRTFYWVSQVGMLAGTIVYVNAGQALGRIESLSGILSPRLIVSFVILGLFPLAAKKFLHLYRRRTLKEARPHAEI